jgi:hypothetical protein
VTAEATALKRRNGTQGSVNGSESVEWFSVENATVDRSVLAGIESRTANLSRTIVRSLHAEDAELNQGVVMSVSGDRITLRDSSVGVVAGRSVACDGARIGILASPVVRGDVRTWLDLRTAVAIGVGMMLGRALLGGVGALLRKAAR